MSNRSRTLGFTLIELLIAISLMAVLAVLGWRGLDSVLSGRERIVEASDGLRAMTVGFTQLEEDLRRAWSVRLLKLPQPSIGFVTVDNDERPALQLIREQLAGSGVPQLQVVVYRLRDDVFERGFSPWVLRSDAGVSAAAEPTMIWQPLLSQVRALHMRAWLAGQGWVPAAALLPVGGRPPSTVPVTGLELMVEFASGQRILRVFPVED